VSYRQSFWHGVVLRAWCVSFVKTFVGSAAKCQAALIKLLLDFVEALLAKVGDVQQVVFVLAQKFADGVDLGALQTVTGTLGEIEVFDCNVKIGA
jgi:hypothetical protein